MILNLLFRTLFLIITILIISTKSNDINCDNTDKCLCFDGFEDYEFQCPPYVETNRIVMHVENGDSILIDCLDLKKFDLNILPDITVNNMTSFSMRECPLPNEKSFIKILNKFQPNGDDIFLTFSSSYLSNISLSKEYFKGLNNLTSLSLHSNDLTTVDEDVFANTPNLQLIDLKFNKINLTSNLFQYTPLLAWLELTKNNIHKLPKDIFKNLINIQRLFLDYNNLKKIDKYMFKDLINMISLELSFNKIEFIDKEAIANCKELVAISLLSNNLKFIPRKLFQQNTLLEFVRLSDNPISELPDYLFSNLRHLNTVHLIYANLKTIPEHIFENSTNLDTILLGNNHLTYLPSNLFKGLEKLTKLTLENNRITKLDNYVLKPLKGLEILNVENNFLREIDENLFKNMKNLKEINFNANRIKFIHRDAFRNNENLVNIFLAYNEITETGTDPIYIFNPSKSLENLDLRNNLISKFDSDLIIGTVNLTSLDLSYNLIKTISINSLITVGQYEVMIDLSNNNITTVNFSLVEEVAKQSTNKVNSLGHKGTIISLSNNPIECNCNALDLVKYFADELDPNIKGLLAINSDNITCEQPLRFKNQLVANLSPNQLTCPLTDLGYNSTCSDECECIWNPYEETIVLDCSYRNLIQFPKINLPNPFKYQHIEVHLENNNLTKGPNETLNEYENITKLYLSNNYINNITWLPSKLEILKLDNNRIQYLDYKVLEKINTSILSNLTLHDNPWSCDCEAENLSKFLQHHSRQVNYTNIHCNNSNTLVFNMNYSELCHPRVHLYVLIGVIVTISICVSVIFIFYALFWRFNQEIKIWCYAHNIFLKWVTEAELDKNKIYDAFISYSHKDEDFVIERLVPVLESGPYPYKLCLHFRNWIAGEFISKQIADSVRDSRRTLIVLSSNFVESVWGKMEFRTAQMQAMKERRARVIIILLGDLDIESLDDELKIYLKTNTYIKWGDPWFWNKLYYALPHSNKRLKTKKQKHMNIMSVVDGKLNFFVKKTNIIHPC